MTAYRFSPTIASIAGFSVISFAGIGLGLRGGAATASTFFAQLNTLDYSCFNLASAPPFAGIFATALMLGLVIGVVGANAEDSRG